MLVTRGGMQRPSHQRRFSPLSRRSTPVVAMRGCPHSAPEILTKLTRRCCCHEKLNPQQQQPGANSGAAVDAPSASSAVGCRRRRWVSPFPGWPGQERSGWTANRSLSGAKQRLLRETRATCPPFVLLSWLRTALHTARSKTKLN